MTAKIYPTRENAIFIFCEDVRKESDGKVTILGAMLGNDVSASLPPPGQVQAVAMARAAFVFSFTDGEGSFRPEIRFCDPQGNTVFVIDPQNGLPLEKNRSGAMNIIVQLNGLPVKEGKHEVRVKLDDKVYKWFLNVRRTEVQLGVSSEKLA